MKKELICICCPRGCHLSMDTDSDTVTGNFCPRGSKYGLQEVKNPTRVITSTVRIEGSNLPMCPVKSAEPIPKGKLFLAMEEINKVHLKAPIHIGDVIISDLAGSGIALIACRDMERI